jgi:hypothetical protein
MAALGALADVSEMAMGRVMTARHYSSVTASDVERGQRPYGPTVYEARLVFRTCSWLTNEDEIPLYVDADRAKRAFRLLCEDGWKDADEPVTDWFETRLVKCERQDSTKPPPENPFGQIRQDLSDSWVIRIERPYDD